MAELTRNDTSIRELPEIEQYKTSLLGSSKALVDAANKRADEQGEYLNPDYEVAGMSPDQLTALQKGRAGIGAYQPFLTSGTQGTTTGAGTLGEGWCGPGGVLHAGHGLSGRLAVANAQSGCHLAAGSGALPVWQKRHGKVFGIMSSKARVRCPVWTCPR